jgi:hypothetical protein
MEWDMLGPNTSWMIVYIADSQPEAHIIVGRLEASGVRSWVQQEPVGQAFGFLVGPLSQVKVLVHPEDYDDAMAILDEEEPDMSGDSQHILDDGN